MLSQNLRNAIKTSLPFLVPIVRSGRERILVPAAQARIGMKERKLRKALLSRILQPSYPFSALRLHGDSEGSDAARGLYAAFVASLARPSQLTEGVAQIKGMSGLAYRSFLNSLVGRLNVARYLEIGSWHGSTVISALTNNECEAVCVDNWSEFGGSANEFRENLRAFKLTGRVRLIESDFRQVNFADLGTFDLFLFDGPHSESDHYDGIVLPQPALSRDHILLVDDWNWASVRLGTLRALSTLGAEVEFAIELRTTDDNTHAHRSASESAWHNGLFAAVIRKAS
ncbi:class I SAM-dependent methyltransferase [Limibaculum sp. M0105]|uniref:Class I SAM-dependent methyltransferase n=1 Tax=Thermohalobaculum xanthum TaxID=2753746 RepID=A0A8J7M7P9_9RHOB|nr:class I SAM-dependent methyltransferase [Thermohalobaculum xanthum]MBK0399745.1 class I SAM-dependent methyltransferase [Thermohalobaculum xanthum]